MSEQSSLPTTTRRKFIAGAAIVGAVATLEASSAYSYFTHRAEPTPPPKTKGVVVVDMVVCGGCLSCKAACTAYNDGEVQPDLARIQVWKDYFEGDYLPQPCSQCVWPGCLYSCPTGALQADSGLEGNVEQLSGRLTDLLGGKLTPSSVPGTNARVVNERECIGCQQCLEGCARIFDLSRVRFNSKKQVAVKCHLCGGQPQCVRFCPVGALMYAHGEEGLTIGYDGQGNIIWAPEAKPLREDELRGVLW